jgi:hypothetical protein
MRLIGGLAAAFLWLCSMSPSAEALNVGQIDTFESGTTEGWTAGGGPLGQTPPVPPTVASTGGPNGVDDAFLAITAQGGVGPGSRLTTFNIFGQWAGNYLTSGLGFIAMDLNNLGQTELTIRLEFENPFAGGDAAVTNAGTTLAPGSGWTHAIFPFGLGELTALSGTVGGALANTSVLRLIHASGLTVGEPVVGVLGIDNIEALAASVPEPAAIFAIGVGLIVFAALGARRRQTS